ncbi:hypothetical protein MMC07_005745 [Pseudocyphellaria aurata]|nr:hypothetical protein [Pseudocyphellaria aurata]
MADGSHDELAMSRVMSVEQIVQKAQNFDYNPLIPLKYWLRTAGTLLKEAAIYEREGNEQQTYLLLFRHAQLVLRDLRTHPDARQVQHRSILLQAEQEVENSLAKLEILKPRLNKRHQRYEQLLRDRDARRASGSIASNVHRYNQDSHDVSESHRNLAADPAIVRGTNALDAGENGDLAVILARSEIRRRATTRKVSRHAELTERKEPERPAVETWKNWELAGTKDDQCDHRDNLSRQMQNLRLQIKNDQTQTGNSRLTLEDRRLVYHYPAVPEQRGNIPYLPALHTLEDKAIIGHGNMQVPELPPKGGETELSNHAMSSQVLHDVSDRNVAVMSPQNELRPATFTFKPSAYLENGSPLRTIFLPPDLRLKFLQIALPNTQANLETCGILCGTLISNALFISKLVIPDQESTSDTCETINEDKLFDFVDGEDLMVLGWIHTHPTQTCFMSSRDLHTHSGYQAMMPESIAIVCAPSKGAWGVFRLTDPPGMKSILSCAQEGLFHPHAESNIYTDALRPGHVFEAKGLEFDIVDLRPIR